MAVTDMNHQSPMSELSMRDGNAIALAHMLAAREQRVVRQQALLAAHQKTLISLTLVIPGEIKNSSGARFLLHTALQVFENTRQHQAWVIHAHEVLDLPDTGPEALWVVDAPAQVVKQATLALEENHALGRLWDFDVINPVGEQGALSRRMLGFAPRRCLLCNEAAHACARARQHTWDELLLCIEHILHRYIQR